MTSVMLRALQQTALLAGGVGDNEKNNAGTALVDDDDRIELHPSAADIVYGDDESADGDDGEDEGASDPDPGVAGFSAKECWEHFRIKLDAPHAMMRLQRTLRKKHGCHGHFLSRLRDALLYNQQRRRRRSKITPQRPLFRRRRHSFYGNGR